MKARIKLEDIARKAGVHHSTVSLALHNSPKLPPATREKIQKLARQMGYQHDPAFSFLAAQRWRKQASSGLTLAVINSDNNVTIDPNNRIILDAIKSRAGELGYNLEFFNLTDYPSVERLGRVIKARGIRGIMLFWDTYLHFPADFDWQSFSVLGININADNTPFFRVMVDPGRAMLIILQKLIERSYQRIGAALWKIPGSDNDRRIIGAFLEFQLEAVPKKNRLPPLLFAGGQLDRETVKDKRGEFYPSPTLDAYLKKWRPDAIIGMGDLIFWLIRASGLRMPEDIGYISFSSISHVKMRNQSEQGVDLQHLGKASVDQLDLLMRTNQYGIPPRRTTILVDPVFMDYETIRPAQ